MDSTITRYKLIWKLDKIAREDFAEYRGFDGFNEYAEVSGFVSTEFNCFVNGLETKWSLYFTAYGEDYCGFYMTSLNNHLDLPNTWLDIIVSIQQSNGVLNEIESDGSSFPDYCCDVFESDEFLLIDEIFEPGNIDENGDLTFVIDFVVSPFFPKSDGSLQYLCILELICQISIENVLEFLYYADRCGAKQLEDECLNFIVSHYNEIESNEEEWKSLSTRLMAKINNALESVHIITLGKQRIIQ